jgi:4-hydroxy-4-methyl-2-oxoglutarate aldolase
MPKSSITRGELEALRQFDTCTISNAIEALDIRPRNEGFISGTAKCIFPSLEPVIGFAVAGRIRTSMPPIRGHCYYDNIEWWRYMAEAPGPKIVVMKDADDTPGAGALFGEIHARISRKLGAVAYVTNGSVRDLKGIESLGFQLFAGGVSVSHAYAHVVDFGEPVEIGGLRIATGDLLHGDLHGVHSIPRESVHDLIRLADEMRREEQELFQYIEARDFNVDKLEAQLRGKVDKQSCK